MRQSALIRAVRLLAALALLGGAVPAFGQSALGTRQADELEAELARVRASISVSEQRAGELTDEVEAMGSDRAQLNAELIAAAQRVKLAEIELGDIEERLLALRTEEARITARLENEDRGINGLVAALQRIGRTPPPALVVDPSDALSSARSAILLASVLPQLRDNAEAIKTDLRALAEVRGAAEDEDQRLRANLSTLSEERLRIATLIEARKRGVVRAGEALEAEQLRAEELAAEAASLDQLIASMEAEIAAVSDAAEAARAADLSPPQASAPETDADPVRLAFANSDRVEPAIPFATARGYLTLPVGGVTVLEFGAADGFGGISKGISIVTRADAQVVSPADGWVVYRGPYLNYGQIVILNTGSGFNIVLAGLDSTAVELGQFVLMGEPVGRMGARTIGQTVATSAGMSRPTLYIELRNDGVPIDPAEWWAPVSSEVLRG